MLKYNFPVAHFDCKSEEYNCNFISQMAITFTYTQNTHPNAIENNIQNNAPGKLNTKAIIVI